MKDKHKTSNAKPAGFFTELRRRRVLTIAGAYIAIAWLITEIAGFLLEQAGAQDWSLRLLAIILVVGFPVAVVIAWVVQKQPGGHWKFDSSKGQHKKVFGAIALGIVTTIGLSWLILPRIEDAPEYPDYDPLPHSVAIMPFLNPAATPNEVTIGTTLYIALTNGLNASRELTQVKLRLKEQPGDLAALGRRVRVMTLLTGRLLRSVGSTRVEMSLLDIKTGKPRWIRRFDWDPTQIMEQGTDIANGVLQSLNLPQMTSKHFAGTDSREAYDELLMGRVIAWKRIQNDEIKLAMKFFQNAIELDPDYVDAYSALANSIRVYLREAGPGGEEQKILEQRMHQTIDKAEYLNPEASGVIRFRAITANDSEVMCRAFEHLMEVDPQGGVDLYYINYCTADISEQERLKRKMVDLDPLNTNSHQELAVTLKDMGQDQEARKEMDRAIELDPRFPWNYWFLALWEIDDNRWDGAVYFCAKAYELNPTAGSLAGRTGQFYAHLGAQEEALAWMERALEISPMNVYSWEGAVGGLTQLGLDEMAIGYADQALEMFPEYPVFSGPNGFGNYRLLRLLRSGETEQALQYFHDVDPHRAGQIESLITSMGDEAGFETDFLLKYDVLTYAWLLLEVGRQEDARILLEHSLKILNQRCEGDKKEDENTEGLGCDVRFILHGFLRQREDALAAMRQLYDEHKRLPTLWRFFEDRGALDVLKDDPDYQELMKSVNDDQAAQLERLREMQRNGKIRPLPKMTAATQ